MKNFLLSFNAAKKFNRNFYFCNSNRNYFYLGHRMPGKCCELVKKFETSPVQEILLDQILKNNQNK